MVGSINLPTNMTKKVEIVVADERQLFSFLTDLVLRVQLLEDKVKAQETIIEGLTNGTQSS